MQTEPINKITNEKKDKALEVEIQCSFFGRIHDIIDCFRDLLIFKILNWKLEVKAFLKSQLNS